MEVGHWWWVAVGYASYLAVVSLTRQDFARARAPLLVVAAVAWIAAGLAGRTSLSYGLEIAVPSLVLLTGYWLSGLLFVRPNVRLEAWLLSVDDRLLMRSGVLEQYRRSPRVLQEILELSYLLVYPAVPAGATILVLSGYGNQLDRFWTIVLLAEFACYGMLPWTQTRPPRAIEGDERHARTALLFRRLNLILVHRASIQVNTLPSGHAAGAFATALAVGSIMPLAGAALLVLAASIAVATVLGRYHYSIDTVLGVLVAAVIWFVVRGS